MKNSQNKPYFTSPSFSAWLLRDHFGEKRKLSFVTYKTKSTPTHYKVRAFLSEHPPRPINQTGILIINAPGDLTFQKPREREKNKKHTLKKLQVDIRSEEMCRRVHFYHFSFGNERDNMVISPSYICIRWSELSGIVGILNYRFVGVRVKQRRWKTVSFLFTSWFGLIRYHSSFSSSIILYSLCFVLF